MSKTIPKEKFTPFVPTPTEPRKAMDWDDDTHPTPPKDVIKARDSMIISEVSEKDAAQVFTTTMLELPIVEELPQGVLGNRHVEVQLSRAKAQTLHRLFKGCQDGPSPARLKNGTGRFVQGYADVIRLFLERAGGGA